MMNMHTRVGLGVALLVVALAPLGCEDNSSSSGGLPTVDGGPPDGNTNPDPDPPVPSECVPPTGPGVKHPGSINAAETWTAADSPHILQYDTSIYAPVTIEPCAEVLIGAGHIVTVRDGGALTAEGTATKRIHFGAQDPSKPYGQIHFAARPGRFAYVTFDGGGAPGNTAVYNRGLLDFQGDVDSPTQESLFVDHVTISGSLSNGIELDSNAGFVKGSNALVIKGSAAHPLSICARSVGDIPVGNYTGNTIDQILLPVTARNEYVDETTTLHERGVPYLVGTPVSAGIMTIESATGKPAVTLTIEPGVTMKFKKDGGLRIANFSGTEPARGSLVAVGTADKKITFASNDPAAAPGAWLGLRFGDLPTTTNKLQHVRVENAGGVSSSGSGSCPDNEEVLNDAAIRITGWPTSQFITDTEIVGSLTNGIDRGWRDDREKVDFLSTISFTGVTLCNQTYPPNAANVCPAKEAVPCPK